MYVDTCCGNKDLSMFGDKNMSSQGRTIPFMINVGIMVMVNPQKMNLSPPSECVH